MTTHKDDLVVQKKVYVFFNSQAGGGKKLLLDWIKKRGVTPIAVNSMSSLRFLKKWNRISGPFNLGIQIDRHILDSSDLKTLESFLEYVENHPGKWYYAPRPNDYVEVKKAALIGMNPMVPITVGGQTKNFIRNIGSRLLSWPWLPASTRGGLKSLAVRLWEKCLTTGSTNSSGKIHNGILQVAVPASLQKQPGNWQPWRPNLDVLRHDLLEHVEDFFPYPQSIHVILLNKCNLKCIMCPYHSPKYTPHHTSGYFRETKLMSKEIFEKISSYAGRKGIALQFGQIEEPLIHKNIFDFFEMAKEAGVPHIHITTNGTLLDRDKADRLCRTGIDSVMFSLDAATPEVYKRIRGTDLSEVEQNIKYFLPSARKNGIRVMVSFIMQPEGQHERERFLEKWRLIGIDSVTYYVLGDHDLQTGTIIQYEQLYDKGERYPCASPWVQSVVFPEGEVSLCCKTMSILGWRGIVSVGNLREQSFDEIWCGAKYRSVRDEVLEHEFKEFDICIDCGIWAATSYLREETATYVRTYNETMETINFV